MGLIKAAKEYETSLRLLFDAVNKLDETIAFKMSDSEPELKRMLSGETYILRKQLQWLDESKDELYDAIDKALEDR